MPFSGLMRLCDIQPTKVGVELKRDRISALKDAVREPMS
jgi:hypothetical protein